MNTQDFINSLRKSKILPDAVMQRLEEKVTRTDRQVTPKSIAKYLIDKGYLSRFQAKKLLTGELTPADDIELQVPVEHSQDTDELLRDLYPAPPRDADATRTSVSAAGPEGDHIDVVQAEHEKTFQHRGGHQLTEIEAAAAPLDPLGGFGYESTEPVEESTAAGTFAGKRARSNQWESKWLFIGFGLVGFLVIAGFILAATLFKTDANKQWERAVTEFVNGQYQSALAKFRDYVEDFPHDDKIPDARVKIANSELRIPYDSSQWETTLEAAKSVLPRLQKELADIDDDVKFDEIRGELAVILPGTALGFIREGIEAPDVPTKQRQLDLAQETRSLIHESAYLGSSDLRNPGVSRNLTELDNSIAIVERQIRMENDYASALVDVRGLTEQGSTIDAFQRYDRLVSTYPELSIRTEMREAVAGISKREADLVKRIETTATPAETADSPIEATIVFAARVGQSSVPGMGDRMIVNLVDGVLYGFRAETGDLVWRKFVGLETTTHPVWLGEETWKELIAVDQRQNHVMRIDAETGNESWRVAIGERFAAPFVSDDRLLVTTLSGKLMQFDPATGAASGAAQLPQTVTVSAVSIPRLPMMFQVGQHSNLYVISPETMTCREVFYLGHRDGSVRILPFTMSDYLIVAENGADYCRLHILRPTENETQLERAQPPIRLEGRVSEPIVRYGRWGLVTSDKGDMRMLELNKANETTPVTIVARTQYSPARQTRKFLIASEGRMWNAAAGLRRYKIQKAAEDFKEDVVENTLDVFVAPPTLINETLFHVRRRHESRLISISAVDSLTLAEIWRNDFGAPLAGTGTLGASRTVALSSQGDLYDLEGLSIDGGVVNDPVAYGSTVIQNLVFDKLLAWPDRLVAAGPPSQSRVVLIDPAQNPISNLADLQPPANRPACRPVRFGPHLLVAALRGQVFRIDPQTGGTVGAPFQPELQPNVEVHWREAAVVADGARFIIGNATGEFYLVEADEEKSLIRIDQLSHGSELVSPLIAMNGKAVGVCRAAVDQIVLVGGEQKLNIDKIAELPAGYVSGPFALGPTGFFVTLDDGKTACFDADLNPLWSRKLPAGSGADRLAGEPVLVDGQVWLAWESGALTAIDAATGEASTSIDVGQPLSGGPVSFSGAILVPGHDGTLHRVSIQ